MSFTLGDLWGKVKITVLSVKIYHVRTDLLESHWLTNKRLGLQSPLVEKHE